VLVETAVAPSLNVTVPVGVPPPTAVTIALSMTGCPMTLEIAEEARIVAVSALLTVWVKVSEVLVFKLLVASKATTVTAVYNGSHAI